MHWDVLLFRINSVNKAQSSKFIRVPCKLKKVNRGEKLPSTIRNVRCDGRGNVDETHINHVEKAAWNKLTRKFRELEPLGRPERPQSNSGVRGLASWRQIFLLSRLYPSSSRILNLQLSNPHHFQSIHLLFKPLKLISPFSYSTYLPSLLNIHRLFETFNHQPPICQTSFLLFHLLPRHN